jgi:glycine oxidase
VVPRIDGTVLVGATVEEAGFDERATAGGVHALLDAACELVPAARDATFLGVRVGLRPATPDELPVIGEDRNVPGLIHASGHYRNGVLLAPITAKLIGDVVAAGAVDPMLAAFSPARFG